MNIVMIAAEYAKIKHAGQFDKLGRPYVGHPMRVACAVESEYEMAAALLHDVLEDTNATVGELFAIGMPLEVVKAVKILTKIEGVPYERYLRSVAANPIAKAVKMADIADNTDPERVAGLDADVRERLAAKYEKALSILSEV